jgi:hypothetical protein
MGKWTWVAPVLTLVPPAGLCIWFAFAGQPHVPADDGRESAVPEAAVVSTSKTVEAPRAPPPPVRTGGQPTEVVPLSAPRVETETPDASTAAANESAAGSYVRRPMGDLMRWLAARRSDGGADAMLGPVANDR